MIAELESDAAAAGEPLLSQPDLYTIRCSRMQLAVPLPFALVFILVIDVLLKRDLARLVEFGQEAGPSRLV